MLKSGKKAEEILKMLAKHPDLTQTKIAKRLGVTDAYVSRVKNGQNGYSLADLEGQRYMKAEAKRRGIPLDTLRARIWYTIGRDKMVTAILDDEDEIKGERI